MKLSRFNELKAFQTSEGVMKPLYVSEELKVIHLKIPAGLNVHPHSHPTPGNLFLIKGSLVLKGESSAVLEEGDMVHIPADYTVGLESITDAEALLISSPSGYRSIDVLYKKLESIQS